MIGQMLTVKSCKDPAMWYNDFIGSTFLILDCWKEIGYKVRQPNGFINFIKFEDATLDIDYGNSN